MGTYEDKTRYKYKENIMLFWLEILINIFGCEWKYVLYDRMSCLGFDYTYNNYHYCVVLVRKCVKHQHVLSSLVIFFDTRRGKKKEFLIVTFIVSKTKTLLLLLYMYFITVFYFFLSYFIVITTLTFAYLYEWTSRRMYS